MQEDFRENIEEFYSPREIFTQTEELNLTEISDTEVNPTGTPQENGATKKLFTQPSSWHSTPTDEPEAPDSPPPHPHIDTSTIASLGRKGNLPGVRLTSAANTLFGVY